MYYTRLPTDFTSLITPSIINNTATNGCTKAMVDEMLIKISEGQKHIDTIKSISCTASQKHDAKTAMTDLFDQLWTTLDNCVELKELALWLCILDVDRVRDDISDMRSRILPQMKQLKSVSDKVTKLKEIKDSITFRYIGYKSAKLLRRSAFSFGLRRMFMYNDLPFFGMEMNTDSMLAYDPLEDQLVRFPVNLSLPYIYPYLF